MWCLVVFQHDLHDQCLSQSKGKLLLEDPLSQTLSCLRPRPLARNRTKRILRCNNQANELQLPSLVVTSESTEPKDNEFELKAVAYAFSKIFQPEIYLNVTNRLSTVPSAIMNSSPSSIFPSEANWETKKKHSLYCGIFRSVLYSSIYKHKNSYGGRNKVHQIDNEARLSRESTVENLAFMQLVPGDDRAVRHICIQCIWPRSCVEFKPQYVRS